MHEKMNIESQYRKIYRSASYHSFDMELTVPCALFCAILFLILGILYITPAGITGLYRPIFIFFSLFSIFRRYPLRSARWSLASAVYFAGIFICNRITGTTTVEFISQELFIIFFVIASGHIWSKREINLMLHSLMIACVLLAIIVLFSNSLFLHTGAQQRIRYLNASVNRNAIAFALVPGAIASMLKLIYSDNNVNYLLEQIFWVAVYVLCSYCVFAIGCRSAFYSMCLGTGCLIWERVRKKQSPAEKMIKELLFIIMLIVGTRLLISTAAGSYNGRLFRWEETGREDLWEKALILIRQKPLFGGGYDYWKSSGTTLGTHNTFLTYMLIGGVIALFFLVGYIISFLFEVLKTNSLIPLAFFAEAIFHMYTESSMDYYAYIPLIFSVILVNYLTYQGNIQDLLAHSND